MTLSVTEFLAIKQITVLQHPTYLPGLAAMISLFRKIKDILKGSQFDDSDSIRNNTTAALKAISQNQFEICFEGWTRHWHRCIDSEGGYFECKLIGIHK